MDSETNGAVTNSDIISSDLPAAWDSGLTNYQSRAIGWDSQDESAVINTLDSGPTIVNSMGIPTPTLGDHRFRHCRFDQ